ncbi:MAG: fumarylacetoacetate hydrolase family protein [Thermoguttaceae bacterium]|nr:fumarylacetoacetate hydrolase family protein [Thermoguttaceae bacterium]MDW8080120.1 fumarylacetoacetate hydrolase family protein [Thermoguttaceae bacterium]
MRLATIQTQEGPRVAGVREDGYVDLHASDRHLPPDLKSLLAGGKELLAVAEEALRRGRAVPADEARLLPPIPNPEKIICVGANYADHAAESGVPVPAEPIIFCKFLTALCAPEQPIVLPRVSQEVDYEGELVVVIGRSGRYIPEDQAREYIAGYTCGNDVSARDWQLRKPGNQWLLGKSFDTFAPCGPVVVTRDEFAHPLRLPIQLRLNGKVMQKSNTDQMVFSVEKLVSYVSQVCTLKPGDLIYTGTPAGVGMARKPPVFLKPGDWVEVEIEGIGVLRNPVIAER